MPKYRIVGGIPDSDGILELPDNPHIIGALYHPVTGEINVVMLVEVPATETKEVAAEKVIHLGSSAGKEARKEL